MRVSTKSRYAVTAMLNLYLNGTDRPATLADLSEKQAISLSYLEQLFAKLRDSGLVRGVRGPGGGYYLAKTPDEVTIGAIIRAVDGGGGEHAETVSQTDTQDLDATSALLWDQLSQQIDEFLSGITLENVAALDHARKDSRMSEKDIKPTASDIAKRAA